MLNFLSNNPYKLDWGNATPEGYSKEKNNLLQIYNVDISSAEKIENCIIYVIGRIAWANKHFPKGTSQKIVFDLRGQPLALIDRARKMSQNIQKKSLAIEPEIKLDIEILI